MAYAPKSNSQIPYGATLGAGIAVDRCVKIAASSRRWRLCQKLAHSDL